MNDAYYQYALQLLDNMTPADLKRKLEEHGFVVKSIHSGKTLAEMVAKDLWEGMEVVGHDQEGVISSILPGLRSNCPPWLTITWADESTRYAEQITLVNIRVK